MTTREPTFKKVVRSIVHDELIPVNKRLDGIDKRLDGSDKRFDGIDKRLDGVDKRFDGVDKRFDGIDKRLDGLELKLYGLDLKIDNLRIEFEEKLEQTFLRFKSEVFDKLDSIVKIISDLRDESVIASEHNRRIEDRLTKLEKIHPHGSHVTN